MSSTQFLFGYDRDGQLRFEDERAAIRFVERLEESHNFCDHCFVPLQAAARLGDLQLCTLATFEHRTGLIEDVPPDEIDEYGGVVEVSRDSIEICDCGWIDLPPGKNRSREETLEHLENILVLLDENGADVNARVARSVVNQAFDDRRSGQFCQVVGEGIYHALEDS